MSITLAVAFRQITCCHYGCGIVFAVPNWWDEKRREDHRNWYCPNGHEQHFPSESAAEKAERFRKKYEREQEQKRLAKLEAMEERTKKEKLQRKLKRVQRGVCPHCNRSFRNLKRHMSCKHGKKKGKRK